MKAISWSVKSVSSHLSDRPEPPVSSSVESSTALLLARLCCIVITITIRLTQLPVPNARAPPLLLVDRRRNDAVLITINVSDSFSLLRQFEVPLRSPPYALVSYGLVDLTGLSRSIRIKETKGALN